MRFAQILYRPRPAVLSALVALVLAAGPAPAANAAAVGIRVLPPSSSAFGQSYEQWSALWWQWALAGSAQDNPVSDPTGENCAVGQGATVWFLAGTFGGDADRSCTVAAGTPLFFPVINTLWADDPGGTATAEDARSGADAAIAGATGSADVDGVAVPDIGRYLVGSPIFGVTLSADNVLGAPPGAYAPAAAAGINLLLAPLTPGSHVVRFHGCFANGFCAGATYHLTVTAGQ
jgi:hypothetical protein